MKPQLVPVILGGRRGIRPFDPIDLFTAGTVGAWYDPSDYSTLFQDSAGTTPVTAVEQPVGLMLDKSQGLVLGSEQIATPFSVSGAGWSAVSNTAVATSTTATGTVPTTATLATTKRYQVSFTASSLSGATCFVNMDSSVAALTKRIATAGNYTFILFGAGAANIQFQAYEGTAFSVTISNLSIKEIPGNHASQATAASRPVLRARYNLLTFSEQFDNAAWSKSGLNTTGTPAWVNAAVAPDGTTTADFLIPQATTANHSVNSVASAAGAGVNTFSVYAKAGGYNYLQMLWGSGTDYANFNLTGAGSVSQNSGGAPTIVAVGNGWYRCTITSTLAGASTVYLQPVPTGTETRYATYLGDNSSGVYVWGADLRTGSSAGTYQRIAAATDYATAGFLPYLAFDGTDDFVASSAINFSTTDKMTLCTGVTKNSDALRGVFAHLGNTATATFRGEAPDASLTTFAFYSTGTAAIQGSAVNVAAPATRVLTGIADIAADTNLLRLNGTQVASNTADQGTGNYSNAAVNVGRRGDNSLFFNGRIYQMVVCGKTLSASELAALESFTNSKTGAY